MPHPRTGRWLVPLTGLGLLLALACGEVPSQVEIAVDYPRKAVAEEPVAWVVTIRNHDSEPHTMRDLDVSEGIATAAFFDRSEPPWNDAFLGEVTGDYNYKYRIELQPGESLELRLEGVALQAGQHIGALDVCIDSVSSCRSFPMRTVVQPSP
jgi:hypothetical protein